MWCKKKINISLIYIFNMLDTYVVDVKRERGSDSQSTVGSCTREFEAFLWCKKGLGSLFRAFLGPSASGQQEEAVRFKSKVEGNVFYFHAEHCS